MPPRTLDDLLSQLEEAKRHFNKGDGKRVEKLLTELARRNFPDALSLIRLHEALLFLRAYPQSREVLGRVEDLVAGFSSRVEHLRSTGADLTPFNYIEYSGIAGTALSGTFSYEIARFLVRRFPERVEVDWDRYEKKERLGSVWPRLLPLLEEDSLVEANIPYLDWLRAAKARDESDLSLLLRGFDRLPLAHREKAQLYDLMELPLRWEMQELPVSRTALKRRVPEVFYHTGALLRRSDVDIVQELDSPPLELERLRPSEGEAILDMVKEATAVRYRELYGITNGDPKTAVQADMGRGTSIFLWGLAPERRLPLRGYAAGFTLKNGVPINYIEGITLFERMEIGFNTFYTFREGESAWVYGRALKLLNQVLGVTTISIDPYQVGYNNEEAIESGAFWFYRKLGFRPVKPELLKLTLAEEKKIKSRPGYRTSVKTLRRLSSGHVVFEMPGSPGGDWDNFQVRNLALAVQHRMAEEFDSDAARVRAASIKEVARALEIQRDRWRPNELRAFENLALVLALIPDLKNWTAAEKSGLVRIIRAKGGADEWQYVNLLRKHARLRDAILKLGS